MRSDEETLAALRRGDEGVFVELVRQHQALMLRVAWRYVRNRTVAEEVRRRRGWRCSAGSGALRAARR